MSNVYLLLLILIPANQTFGQDETISCEFNLYKIKYIDRFAKYKLDNTQTLN